MTPLVFFLLTFRYSEFGIDSSPLFVLPDSYNMKSMAVSDQYLVLLTRSEPYLHVFDFSGQLQKQWGEKGQGPEEFTSVQDIALTGDILWVLNKLPGKVVSFSTEGQYRNTLTLNNFVFPQRIQAIDGKILIQEGGRRRPRNDLFLLQGGKTSKLRLVDLGETKLLKPINGPTCIVPMPFTPQDNWCVFYDGTYVWSEKNSTILRFYQMKGENLGEWELEASKHPVPETAREIWRNKNFPDTNSGMGLPIVQWRKEAEKLPLPKFYPAVMQLIADGTRLWVLRSFSGKDQHWECYENGRKTARLTLTKHLRVTQIHNGRVYAVDLTHVDTPVGAYTMR